MLSVPRGFTGVATVDKEITIIQTLIFSYCLRNHSISTSKVVASTHAMKAHGEGWGGGTVPPILKLGLRGG
jgi:hypothetical protein